jgi:hypothetical protein
VRKPEAECGDSAADPAAAGQSDEAIAIALNDRMRAMATRRSAFGEVIATRRLTPRGQSGPRVTVSLGTPREASDGTHWECPFRVSGGGMRRVEYGRGYDAFQALALAHERIRRCIDQMDPPLVWDGVFEDHSGFNRMIPWIPGPRRGERMSVAAGTRRLERIVDGEVRRWALEMKRRYIARHAADGRRARKTLTPRTTR